MDVPFHTKNKEKQIFIWFFARLFVTLHRQVVNHQIKTYQIMKKNYQKLQMEVVTINQRVSLLSGSYSVNSIAGGIFDGTVTGGSGSARAPEFEDIDWDHLEDAFK